MSASVRSLQLIADSLIGKDAYYKKFRTSGKKFSVVHTLSLDITQPRNAIRLVKGFDRFDGLESIQNIGFRYQGVYKNDLIGMVNGNFWRAYRNSPIGPCVIDGEVVEMHRYKLWSSAFFDRANRMHIDTFTLTATATWRGTAMPVASVNRRTDSNGIVLFNSYVGDRIPYINQSEVEERYNEYMRELLFLEQDSTEVMQTREQMLDTIAGLRRESNAEYAHRKVRLRYLRMPGVNTIIPCEVVSVDSGTVAIPSKGCVLSIPAKSVQHLPAPGDTVDIFFSTNVQKSIPFMNAVSGTPRLIRHGVAKHEASAECVTSKRFISHNLARTAIGTSKDGTRVIFAVVEASNPKQGRYGATLQQMSQIMKILGCFNAVNLDGGGSSGMLVGTDHVFFEGAVDPPTRKIAVALLMVQIGALPSAVTE